MSKSIMMLSQVSAARDLGSVIKGEVGAVVYIYETVPHSGRFEVEFSNGRILTCCAEDVSIISDKTGE